jgi:hypothetical protein
MAKRLQGPLESRPEGSSLSPGASLVTGTPQNW